MKSKTSLIWVAFILLAVGLFWSLKQEQTANNEVITKQTDKQEELYPIQSILHGHGIAVDVADPARLYIATHQGLAVLVNDKDLYRMGSAADDYMGFSVHPTDPKVFFTSGHPATGGNLGFQKSQDRGMSWKRVSMGVNGPVDFHTMAVSPVNPDLIYGWHGGRLQRSKDGGNNWQVLSTNPSNIISLAAHPTEEQTLYATTAEGLLVSKDSAASWNLLSGLPKDPIVALAIDSQNSQIMLLSSVNKGLQKSEDGGLSWNKIDESFDGDLVLFMTFDKNQKNKVYALTRGNALYKSIDGGSSWTKIR